MKRVRTIGLIALVLGVSFAVYHATADRTATTYCSEAERAFRLELATQRVIAEKMLRGGRPTVLDEIALEQADSGSTRRHYEACVRAAAARAALISLGCGAGSGLLLVVILALKRVFGAPTATEDGPYRVIRY